MMMTLTQKERVGLKDALHDEHLCIQKYNGYAQKVQDPQLKQMFVQHAAQEQQHADTLQQILSNQQPAQSQSGQAQGQGQQPNQANTYLNPSTEADMQLCTDLLMTENHVSGSYDNIVFATANPGIRQAVQHIQQEEQQHGADLINYMAQQGQFPAQ